MDDIVAIKVSVKRKNYYFLTWGRIFHPVDSTQLLEVIKPHLKSYALENFTAIELCDSLQEASSGEYFYEGLFNLSQTKIPFGKNYPKWKVKMVKALKAGKEIYFLGK